MNITFALDDELIAAAKAVAARHGTSVTSLVRTSLEQQVALDNDRSSFSASGVMQELIDYSMGFKPRTAVMAELGLNDYGSLLRLLNAANLPHPIVPIAKRKAMVAEMKMVIQGE
jgi:plasmid stability protein